MTRTWVHLNLTGQLVFISGTKSLTSPQGFVPNVTQLDLATGSLTTLLQPPDNTWTSAATVSPDGQQILIAYAPPPPSGQIQFGATGLYLLPSDGSGGLMPLVDHVQQKEAHFNPMWSPDGRYVYYTHLTTTRDANGLLNPQYTVERLVYPDGQPEALVQNAYWPRLSADGSQLVFVTFDPASYTSQLFVANADGTEPKQIVLPNTLLVDAPLFSPDELWIIFSGADLGPAAPLSWLDRLLGVRVASAHNIPSDWWRVPVAGGQPEQLTKLYASGLYGDFSPDGRYFVFMCLSGLFVMPAPVTPTLPPDSGLTLIL